MFDLALTYPVQFTKPTLEIAIKDVPTNEPLSPLSWVIAGPAEAPWTKKFSNRMFWTTPLLLLDLA